MSYRELEFRVPGVPLPQGSHKIVPIKGTGKSRLVNDNPALDVWRQLAATAAGNARRRQGWALLDGPATVELLFYMPRPKSHWRTGRNAGILREGAPLYPTVKPDLDKLARAVFDALSAGGVWRDDSRAVGLSCWKQYADGGKLPGVDVVVRSLEESA